MTKTRAIHNFMEKYPEIDNMCVEKCLYVLDGTCEMFVTQCENSENNVIIFKYDCGRLCEIRSEKDTFVKYLLLIPLSDASEFVSF